MDHSTIIDDLGGTFAVAKAIGCHPGRVSRWRAGGIPHARFPAFVKLASRYGLYHVTLETLYAGRLLMERRAARRARAAA